MVTHHFSRVLFNSQFKDFSSDPDLIIAVIIYTICFRSGVEGSLQRRIVAWSALHKAESPIY
jgi:hypothetical protein